MTSTPMLRSTTGATLALATVLAGVTLAAAQQPAAGAAPAPRPTATPVSTVPAGTPATPVGPPATQAGKPASLPAVTAPGADAGFSYRAEGRRDPFVSLLRRGSDEVIAAKGQGLASLDVNDLSLRGIVATQGTFVAMLQAPDNRTYLVRPNDTLRDARVKAITADAVVFVQKVSDPLDVVKEREVRKPLRPNEEGK